MRDNLTWQELHQSIIDEIGDAGIARHVVHEAAGNFSKAQHCIVSPEQYTQVINYITELWKGRPLQYVFGHWQFRSIDVGVDERVLIPRPETEMAAQAAIDRISSGDTVVDLGTGSGVIALSIAHECDADVIWATDVSEDALDVARANAKSLGATIHFSAGDWYGALPTSLRHSVNCIVSNPPYVASNDDVEPIVLAHEPHGALFGGGHDGLHNIRVIIRQASHWLVPGGVLVIEIAPAQSDAVRHMAHAAHLVDVAIGKDLAGRDRYLIARSSDPAYG